MIKITDYSNQTYEEIEKEPHCGLIFFYNEKDIISIVNTHFVENIKESIQCLKECLKYDFTKSCIFEFKNDYKTIYLVKNPL